MGNISEVLATEDLLQCNTEPDLTAKAGGTAGAGERHLVILHTGLPGCGKSVTSRMLRQRLEREGRPCEVVSQDYFLTLTRGNCKLCGDTKCNFNVLDEVALHERIELAIESVKKRLENIKGRGLVLIEGHALLALPWLVGISDLSVWINTSLHRCAEIG